jgi:hypothetical protein
MPRAGARMREHLTTQGSCLTDAERRNLAVGLRFSTGVCLSLVGVALALGGLLVAACALVATTNLCLQSDTFAWLERRRTPSDPITS